MQVDGRRVAAVADHGDQLAIAKLGDPADQFCEDRAADAAAFGAVAHVDRVFDAVAVRRAGAIGRAIAEADHHAAEVRGEPREAARTHVFVAPLQLGHRGRLLLEAREAVQHVVSVDLLHRRHVAGHRRPQLDPLTENTPAPRDRGCASTR